MSHRMSGRSPCSKTFCAPAVMALCLTAIFTSLSTISSLARADEWVYAVVPGDNLWTFSERYLDSVMRFEDLRKLNNIEDPLKIRPGTLIRVPMAWIESNAVPATITAVHGSIMLTKPSGETVALTLGQQVLLGDTIRTAGDSSVAIRFADDSVVTLYSDSELRLDHLSAHGKTGMADTRVRLLKGRLDTRVTKAQGPGSRFEIQTPSAISAVRGTEYRAAVDTERLASNIEVLEGSVAVNGDIGQELVPAGFGTQVAPGAAPISPRELLPAPLLKDLPDKVQILGWPLRWEAQAGATAYRAEIARLERFDTVIWQTVNDRVSTPLPDLADGIYHVRVRAIDSLGLEGIAAVARFGLDVHPQAPIALSPSDGQIIRGGDVRLSWANASEATAYRLEVATDAMFSDVLTDRRDLRETNFASSASTTPGRYFWRVTSIAGDGELGPPGAARVFEIRPAHQPVDASIQAAPDDRLTASWKPAAPGLKYQVQIAYNSNFNKLELDRVVEQASLEISASGARDRFLRVRTVEADGYAGPWGASQTIAGHPKERTDDHGWLIFPFFYIVALLAI